MADISPKQAKAITALMTSKTNAEAAVKAGISERALYRWLKEEPFQKALDLAEKQLLGSSVRRMASLLGKSVDELEKLLTNSTPASDRLRAIRIVLDIYPRLKEVSSFADRMTRLEEVLER